MNEIILHVSKDPPFQHIAEALQRHGYQVFTSGDRTGIERQLAMLPPDLILLDHPWPTDVGQDAIERWVRDYPALVLCHEVGIKSALDEIGIKAALDVLQLGAMEFLVKPIDPDKLANAARRIIDYAPLRPCSPLHTRVVQCETPSLLVGDSEPIRRLLTSLQAVAPTEATVLILGESGVGKERVAQEIHRLSLRAKAPLIWVDCCSLQEALFESELFGHERGAFTGATQRKTGLIEQARGGTLFLDEIGEIPPKIQAKLLRVLETKQFRRLGGVTDIQAEVRICAATNRDLDEMARLGEFRRDLLYRLNAFSVSVAPLRERREDIPVLTQHFLANLGGVKRVVKQMSESAMQQLMDYDWPGNVRELRNVIERAIILSGDKLNIDSEYLALPKTAISPSTTEVSLNFDYAPTLVEIEQHYMRLLMDRCQGHRAKVAKILGISERTLYRLLANQSELDRK